MQLLSVVCLLVYFVCSSIMAAHMSYCCCCWCCIEYMSVALTQRNCLYRKRNSNKTKFIELLLLLLFLFASCKLAILFRWNFFSLHHTFFFFCQPLPVSFHFCLVFTVVVVSVCRRRAMSSFANVVVFFAITINSLNSDCIYNIFAYRLGEKNSNNHKSYYNKSVCVSAGCHLIIVYRYWLGYRLLLKMRSEVQNKKCVCGLIFMSKHTIIIEY